MKTSVGAFLVYFVRLPLGFEAFYICVGKLGHLCPLIERESDYASDYRKIVTLVVTLKHGYSQYFLDRTRHAQTDNII